MPRQPSVATDDAPQSRRLISSGSTFCNHGGCEKTVVDWGRRAGCRLFRLDIELLTERRARAHDTDYRVH